ncbi:MAG: hypothetical protein KBS89_07565 [Bacteroidales bacterium]|nr:hypothetical protein [Candidatus Egerieousia equi]
MRENTIRLRNIWHGMKQRCENPKATGYKHYGQRGIKVCEQWRNNYYSFVLWAFLNGYESCLSIDRINNNGDYCPTNCRWATLNIQANNNSRNAIIEGKTVADWAFEYGINYRTLHNRIFRSGMSLNDALTSTLYRTKRVAKMDKEGNILEVFDSAKKAANGNNSLRYHIQLCCNGEKKTANGYRWKYYEDNKSKKF